VLARKRKGVKGRQKVRKLWNIEWAEWVWLNGQAAYCFALVVKDAFQVKRRSYS